jgi:hypothetical protein
MAIPQEIKIGMRKVTVQVTDLGDLGVQGSLLGQYQPDTLTILLNNRIADPVLMMETFWHELVHAINDKIRFDFELNKEIQRGADPEAVFNFEESFTEDFSQTLMQVLSENKILPLPV